MPMRGPKRPKPVAEPAPLVVQPTSEYVLLARCVNRNDYSRGVLVSGYVTAKRLAGLRITLRDPYEEGSIIFDAVGTQVRWDGGDALNYQDNTTGAWLPYTYAHTANPVLHPEVKPEFAGGKCEEQVYARKYLCSEDKTPPLQCLAWRGQDGTASKEIWINLMAVADPSVPVAGDHSYLWKEAWKDTDYEVQFFGPGGTERRISFKSPHVEPVTEWTAKIPEYCVFGMDGLHPHLTAGGRGIWTIGHPTVWIDGQMDAGFPEPQWEIDRGSGLSTLRLRVDKPAIEYAFDQLRAQTLQVRC